MKHNINEYLSPHFQLWEFLHNRSTEGLTPEIYGNLKVLAWDLGTVRMLLGNHPLHIISGYRTLKHHLEIYAAMGITDRRKIPMDSYHLKGLAADFMHDSMDSENCRRRLETYWQGGMEEGTIHVHLDLGPRRRFHA